LLRERRVAVRLRHSRRVDQACAATRAAALPPRRSVAPAVRPECPRSLDRRPLQRVGHAEAVEFAHDDAIPILPGDLVGGIAPHLELTEALLERVVCEEASNQRIAEIE